jgi:hypothetical protein
MSPMILYVCTLFKKNNASSQRRQSGTRRLRRCNRGAFFGGAAFMPPVGRSGVPRP